MRRDPLRARRVLIVAPHPDDEAIGAFALIRRLLARGARVIVIVVSDGAASHPGSRAWPPSRLAAERQRESRRAMAVLGIAPADVRFLGLPDGGLARDGTATAGALARALRGGLRAELIVGPTEGDDHADHRAVASALASVAPRGVRRLGYKVWPSCLPDRRSLDIRLTPALMRAKRRTIHGYRTQTGRIADATDGFTMTWRHLGRFVRPSERFEVLA